LNGRFPGIPASFEDAIREGGKRIRRYERMRKAIVLSPIAAGLILAVVFGFRGMKEPEADMLRQTETEIGYSRAGRVFAHPQDVFYHRFTGCKAAIPDAEEMPVETAEEFDLLPCEYCFSQEGGKT